MVIGEVVVDGGDGDIALNQGAVVRGRVQRRAGVDFRQPVIDVPPANPTPALEMLHQRPGVLAGNPDSLDQCPGQVRQVDVETDPVFPGGPGQDLLQQFPGQAGGGGKIGVLVIGVQGKASPFTPRMEASVAADTVPEYRTLMPTLGPRLMPETTRSGGLGSSSAMAILTQSAGKPLTAKPVKPPSRHTSFTRSGVIPGNGVSHGALLAFRGHYLAHLPET